MKAKIQITALGKVCTRCNTDKPLSAYYPGRGETLGLKAECKECWSARTRRWYESNKDRKAARNADWRKANPDRIAVITRRSNLRRKFDITVADYDAMLAAQGGRCAACGSTDNGDRRFDSFPVDHDHRSGKIRGLLCSRCNKALGLLDDDPDRLMALAAYLLQHTNLLEIGASA